MKSRINVIFLFILILLVGIGVYQVLKPFVISLLVAFVLSQLFDIWYIKIRKVLKSRSLASIATCSIILLIIFIPLAIISSLIISETNQLFKTIQENNLKEKLESISLKIPLVNLEISNQDIQSVIGTEEFSKSVKNTGAFFIGVAKTTYQSTSNFVFMAFVMFFSLYYFFKDGNKIIRKIMDLSPLKNEQEALLIKKFLSISRATLKGTLVIALIQGGLTAILFWITGVKSPVLWGLVAAVVSLIPLIGPVLVWTPVGIVMILLGFVWQGIVILAVGALLISSIDNFLRPMLVGSDASLHPLLVFLSTLGGLALFGFSGFLIGPIIIVLFITLLHIYQIEFRQILKRINE